ncbi:DegT/DnrJ/EryC1/StrS family aminotransferase [Treponema socranskii]|uniref:DegT/DnrJ/EryC1/StrS family aminotransferase n=1 Tax=Treponema socranskii TaxID=53419 RepID=UPI003D8B99DB
MDPSKIEAAITSKTAAILPVHVYGNPCDIETIQSIADTYHIKVIYDAAHAFNVKKNEQSILTAGDFSVLSFHATKTYNTIEGGAIVCKDEQTKKSIDAFKNFGYTSEIYVTEIGINGKLDEIRSAYGLLNLKKNRCCDCKTKTYCIFL